MGRRERRRANQRQEPAGWRASLGSSSGRTVVIALVLAAVAAGALIWAAYPGDDGGPATAGGGEVIDVDEARAMVDAGEGVLVDTRDEQSYQMGHAAGAVLTSINDIVADPHLPAITEIPDEIAMILYCT